MFDRFTRQALQALFCARTEVTQLGSSAIEPEHILLGLLNGGNCLGSRILAGAGAGVDNPRRDILHRLPRPEKIPESDEIPFSGSCERTLKYAAEETDRLSHKYVATAHLLLGLLREEGSVAAEMLVARGFSTDGVRGAIIESLSRGDEPELPGPPPTLENVYQWPQIPFVPSGTVHILHSGMQWPQLPVINFTGMVFSAYGFTLEEIIVRAWQGSRWHVDISPELRDDARFDFLMVLPEPEPWVACLESLRTAIERQFAVQVTREIRQRDVFRLTSTNAVGQMLRRHADPQHEIAFSNMPFAIFMGRSQDDPMFPLETFAVHSVPLMFLVNWFEEILGGQVIDDADLPGIYDFELKERVNTPAALMQLLHDDAGLVFTRGGREIPTLIVRRAPPPGRAGSPDEN